MRQVLRNARVLVGSKIERGLAVVADVHGHRELAQPVGDRVGEQPLVVGK